LTPSAPDCRACGACCGTDDENRCGYLHGTIGEHVTCGRYDSPSRPRICGLFPRDDPVCHLARFERLGIPCDAETLRKGERQFEELTALLEPLP